MVRTKQVIKIVIITFIIMIILWGGITAFRYYSATVRGKTGAKEFIESKEHRIYSYEHFYELYATIKSKKVLYESQKESLKNAESASERERIRQNISGIRSSLSRAIEEYNADASKVETKGKFKSDDLPDKIKMSDITNE